MTICPKCGSTTITGPRFVIRDAAARFYSLLHDDYGEPEALRYTCAVCGYTTDKPTLSEERARR